MLKLAHSLRSCLSPQFLKLHPFSPIFIPPFFISAFSSLTHSPDPKNPFLYNYLIHSLDFPKPQAFTVSNRFSYISTTEKPQSLIKMLRDLGFSDAHIRHSARACPQILFLDAETKIKPKIQLFQELGLSGPDLGKFISKNASLLTRSLSNGLKPCVETLRKVFPNDLDNGNLIQVLQRCHRLVSRDPGLRFLSNVEYLKSCGIVGSQLVNLLKRQPRVFVLHESAIRQLVSRVLEMGFSVDSRMFVHAIHTVSCLSNETLMRKLQLMQTFGLTEDESMQLFRRSPPLLRCSEEKLKVGFDFFMNTLKLEKKVLVNKPNYLTFSMENRIIPRYRLLQYMESKGLFKNKKPGFLTALILTEEEFLEKYILKFRDKAEELAFVYKGNLLEPSEE